jgi:hypothetical protein
LASAKRAPRGSDSRAVAVLPWTSMSIEWSAARFSAPGSSREVRALIVCAQSRPRAEGVSWAQARALSPFASALR